MTAPVATEAEAEPRPAEAEHPERPDVFISHSRKDKAFVRRPRT